MRKQNIICSIINLIFGVVITWGAVETDAEPENIILGVVLGLVSLVCLFISIFRPDPAEEKLNDLIESYKQNIVALHSATVEAMQLKQEKLELEKQLHQLEAMQANAAVVEKPKRTTRKKPSVTE